MESVECGNMQTSNFMRFALNPGMLLYYPTHTHTPYTHVCVLRQLRVRFMFPTPNTTNTHTSASNIYSLE